MRLATETQEVDFATVVRALEDRNRKTKLIIAINEALSGDTDLTTREKLVLSLIRNAVKEAEENE